MPTATLPALLVGAVAILCALIAFGAWRAVVRTGNRRIHFVVLAFLLLAVKSLVKAVDLADGHEGSAFEESAFSLADLAAVALIAWPLLSRRP
ncbi:MAG: hypothetical protein V4510_03400 [bacterium]